MFPSWQEDLMLWPLKKVWSQEPPRLESNSSLSNDHSTCNHHLPRTLHNRRWFMSAITKVQCSKPWRWQTVDASIPKSGRSNENLHFTLSGRKFLQYFTPPYEKRQRNKYSTQLVLFSFELTISTTSILYIVLCEGFILLKYISAMYAQFIIYNLFLK